MQSEKQKTNGNRRNSPIETDQFHKRDRPIEIHSTQNETVQQQQA